MELCGWWWLKIVVEDAGARRGREANSEGVVDVGDVAARRPGRRKTRERRGVRRGSMKRSEATSRHSMSWKWVWEWRLPVPKSASTRKRHSEGSTY